jgi:L-alanine-DL-glutamate epimerase-like enolase superfamily enzyme
MWLNRPPVKNGRVTVSDEPGLGIRLDARMIEQFRIA